MRWAIRAWGPKVVPQLVRVLENTKRPDRLVAASMALGALGEPSAVEPMIEFVLDGQGVMELDAWNAKTDTLLFLGDLLHRTADRRGLEFLAAGLDPDYWRARIGWNWGYANESIELELASQAARGLALSGRPEALKHLRAFMRTDTYRDDAALKGAINRAVLTYQDVVRAGGLDAFRDPQRPRDLEERIIWLDSAAYDDDIERWGPDAVRKLLRILEDPVWSSRWEGAVLALGMIGDQQAVQPLIAFVLDGEGRIDEITWYAKTAVLISLGYLLHKTENNQALAILKAGLDPMYWRSRVLWKPRDVHPRDDTLAELAATGLGLSGRRGAIEALHTFRSSKAYRDRGQMRTTVDEAIQAHGDVLQAGSLKHYYGRLKHYHGHP